MDKAKLRRKIAELMRSTPALLDGMVAQAKRDKRRRRFSFSAFGQASTHSAAEAARVLMEAEPSLPDPGGAAGDAGGGRDGDVGQLLAVAVLTGPEVEGAGDHDSDADASVAPAASASAPPSPTVVTAAAAAAAAIATGPKPSAAAAGATAGLAPAERRLVSIVHGLPAAESLVISLAAAERRIAALEKENNRWRTQV